MSFVNQIIQLKALHYRIVKKSGPLVFLQVVFLQCLFSLLSYTCAVCKVNSRGPRAIMWTAVNEISGMITTQQHSSVLCRMWGGVSLQ